MDCDWLDLPSLLQPSSEQAEITTVGDFGSHSILLFDVDEFENSRLRFGITDSGPLEYWNEAPNGDAKRVSPGPGAGRRKRRDQTPCLALLLTLRLLCCRTWSSDTAPNTVSTIRGGASLACRCGCRSGSGRHCVSPRLPSEMRTKRTMPATTNVRGAGYNGSTLSRRRGGAWNTPGARVRLKASHG